MTTRTLEVMKQNPLKSTLTLIGSAAAVAVFFWSVEDRYVKAADFQQFQQRQEQFQQQFKQQQQQNVNNFRRQMLEDELFELQLKVNEDIATSIDKAKILRIQRQLQQLQ